MKLLTFTGKSGWRLGVRTATGIIDVAAAATALNATDVPTTMEAVIAAGPDTLAAFVDRAGPQSAGAVWLLDEADIQFGPCTPNPGKIICVGLNYRRHAAESGAVVPQTPIFFSKFNNSIAAPNEVVPLPATAVEYDYEVELGLVMGKQTRDVTVADALDHVLGYCTANDLSARDLQMRTSQWLLGKTLDKFMPIGPYLVTADEVADPQKLALKTWVNGELRQNSNTADMIFSCAEVISYASQYFTLEAGDVIITGTPEGVILGMAEKKWLKAGDEVTVEVETLGKLSNRLG